MSWYQPDDLVVAFRDDHGSGHLGDLYLREKIKLFLWNRLLPGFVRIRLTRSCLYRWVIS